MLVVSTRARLNLLGAVPINYLPNLGKTVRSLPLSLRPQPLSDIETPTLESQLSMDAISNDEPAEEQIVSAQRPLSEPSSPVRKSLKRPRVEIDAEFEEGSSDVLQLISPSAEMACTSSASSRTSPVRDERYYMEDGSCVIRVGDTLFNVCRVHL